MIKTRTKRITLNSNSIFIESGTYFWDLDMLFKEIENLPKYEYDPKNNILDSTFEADCTYYPSFTTNFLSFCLKYDKLPSINQLLTYYISENKIEKIGQYLCFENTKDKKKKKYNIDHVKNHIIRSYPSLIREFQIFIGLSFINRNGEGKIDFDVVYDTNYDNKGLDIVIEQKGKAIFGIKIYYAWIIFIETFEMAVKFIAI